MRCSEPEDHRIGFRRSRLSQRFWRHFLNCLRNKYFCFKGRASRTEYWGWMLISATLKMLLLSLLIHILKIDFSYEGTFSFSALPRSLIYLFAAIDLPFCLPTWSATVRRLHDLGISGWLILLGILPVGMLFILLVALFPGQPQANRYGEPPNKES